MLLIVLIYDIQYKMFVILFVAEEKKVILNSRSTGNLLKIFTMMKFVFQIMVKPLAGNPVLQNHTSGSHLMM